MITFLDHRDIEYGAISVIRHTNAVNGERSVSGEIYTNSDVLNNIDRGWRLRFEDEYYVVIYAKPVDVGQKTQVSFDAIHQFFGTSARVVSMRVSEMGLIPLIPI